jgi:hypothetical protein
MPSKHVVLIAALVVGFLVLDMYYGDENGLSYIN